MNDNFEKQYLESGTGKKISELFIRLELCCNYRNIADYKDIELTKNNVNYLKKTLLIFHLLVHLQNYLYNIFLYYVSLLLIY